MTELYGGKVLSVEPDSIAEEVGIEPGDFIVSINGHTLTDVIDYRFYIAEEDVDVVVRRDDKTYEISIEKDYDDRLGIEFEEELFDSVRTCGNRCIFCFVQQLPRGMRRSLYLKDDDYRLSFLYGNFVTLASVSEADMSRIVEQRLSPLFVSVHTTDPELRREMLRGRTAPDVMEQLCTLTDAGITLHTQIVICPGVNDSEHLDRSVHELAELYPGVVSVGVVPVGLTQHRRIGPELSVIDARGARGIVKDVRKWQREFSVRFGTRLVWASDEMYLLSGMPIPSARAYEGFPQLENGIGLVRRFIDDARKTVRRLPPQLPCPLKITLVTGELAATLVRDLAYKLNKVDNLEVTTAPIKNNFFGESVTVAGLLTGQDIRVQLDGRDLGDAVVVPVTMLRDSAFLDDVTIDELSSALRRPVIAVEPLPSAILNWLTRRGTP